MTAPTRVAPLGDRAASAYFANEADAASYARSLQTVRPPWLQDVVPAYLSVGLHFDFARIRLRAVLAWAEAYRPTSVGESAPPVRHDIPVCYEMNLDLEFIARRLQQTVEEVVQLHLAGIYTIYAIGFVPGFPYLGYLPEPLCGVPRLAEPRLRVPAGAVGLTGRQTGIYPLERPGGWPILGRTPLELVHLEDEYFPLRVGDEVRFTRIDTAEFARLAGERLAPKR